MKVDFVGRGVVLSSMVSSIDGVEKEEAVAGRGWSCCREGVVADDGDEEDEGEAETSASPSARDDEDEAGEGGECVGDWMGELDE